MGSRQRSEATSGWIAVGFLIVVALILLIADPLSGNDDTGDGLDTNDDFPFVAYIAPLEGPAETETEEQVDEVLGRTESSAGHYADASDAHPQSTMTPADSVADVDEVAPERAAVDDEARSARGSRSLTD